MLRARLSAARRSVGGKLKGIGALRRIDFAGDSKGLSGI